MRCTEGLVRLVPVLILVASCQQPGSQVASQTQAASAPSTPTPIERGSYLVTVGGCNDCHSPKVFTSAGPEPDTSRLLSGHPASEKLTRDSL